MLYLTCVTLVLLTALAEMAALRQRLQQRELAGVLRASVVAVPQAIHKFRD